MRLAALEDIMLHAEAFKWSNEPPMPCTSSFVLCSIGNEALESVACDLVFLVKQSFFNP